MDTTIKRILGEREDEREEPKEKPEKAAPVERSGENTVGPEDAEVDELANLWHSGNQGNVVQRFIEMDNETSVKLVFAIGREGALELARMVDQMLEQSPEESSESGVDSVEPERIEPPKTDAMDRFHSMDAVSHLLGQGHRK